MLLGIPFHISLIYSSHSWHVNSAEPSWWLTLFNDFIHAFRMQVFFVISGYFSYMLFMRYPLKKWWKVRVERVGIPMLTAIPLLTLPQFIMLHTSTARRKTGTPFPGTTNLTPWRGSLFPTCGFYWCWWC
ncbi:acyltransferase family protein [Klebsiella pneumoniae]|nr:acyltransferase family protein [Klebsiella pneumoniae]